MCLFVISFQLYHDLCVWLGVRDVSARLHEFLHISTTNFYQTLIPTEQTLTLPPMQMKNQSAENNGGGGGGVALPSAPPQIERTPKPLHTWSSDEWRTFSTRMCAFIQDQIEDIQPALTSKSTLAAVFDSRPRGADECCDSSDEQRPNGAEVCIVQMLRCFAKGTAHAYTRASRGRCPERGRSGWTRHVCLWLILTVATALCLFVLLFQTCAL